MSPMFGLILLLTWSGFNALIASKRRRSGWAIFGLSILPILPLVILASMGTHGNGAVMGLAAFACPLLGFVVAISLPNGFKAAAQAGAHGDFVRCPFCAEPVRKLATKCRHCASDLTD